MSDDLNAQHESLREWRPGAKERPSHGGHLILRYIATGALSGDMRPVWRCSCDPVNQYGIYNPYTDEWSNGVSPEQHIATGADR